MILVIVLGSIFIPLALLVIVSVLASLFSVLYAVLPGSKVPFRYTFRSLQARWLTTLVTAGAFTVVVALLIWMLAFVNGMSNLTESSGHPGNILVLSDGSTDEAFSNLPGNISMFELPDELQKRIRKDPDGRFWTAREVYVIVTHMLPDTPDGRRKRRFVQMRGIDDPEIAGKVHGIELEQGGEWWSPGGARKVTYQVGSKKVEGDAYEVVLGDGVAKTFGLDRGGTPVKPVQAGEVIDIGPLKCYVSGVMKPGGSTFGSEVWAKDEYVKKQFGKDNYSSFVVRAANPAEVPIAVAALKDYKGTSLKAEAERDYYAKLNQTNQQFTYAIGFVAIILVFGGALGVMNTMFAAISQRSKDIGVLRLIGFSRFQILMSFLLESLTIAILGGLIGLALGCLSHGLSATSIVSSGQGGGKTVVLRLAVNAYVLGVGLAFTFVMGAVGGLVPALSAMRLRPLESLR